MVEASDNQARTRPLNGPQMARSASLRFMKYLYEFQMENANPHCSRTHSVHVRNLVASDHGGYVQTSHLFLSVCLSVCLILSISFSVPSKCEQVFVSLSISFSFNDCHVTILVHFHNDNDQKGVPLFLVSSGPIFRSQCSVEASRAHCDSPSQEVPTAWRLFSVPTAHV